MYRQEASASTLTAIFVRCSMHNAVFLTTENDTSIVHICCPCMTCVADIYVQCRLCVINSCRSIDVYEPPAAWLIMYSVVSVCLPVRLFIISLANFRIFAKFITDPRYIPHAIN